MKLSYCIIPAGKVQEVNDIVAQAERAGIDIVWIPDESFMRDPYVVLASAAVSAKTITLGVGIANPYTRHPIQLARAVGTLSEILGGRIIFGIGAGLRSTRDAIDAPNTEFVKTTRDCISIMQRLFAGEIVSFDGPAFRLHEVALGFKPAHPIPIYVASTHRAAFEMAGELTDGAIIGNVAVPSAMATVVGWVRDAASKSGRDSKSIKIVAWNIIIATDDPATAYDTVRESVARSIAVAHREIRQLLAIDQDQWQSIQGVVRKDRGKVTPELVPNELIDKLTIIGSLDECVEKLRGLAAAGADIAAVRPTLELLRKYDWNANAARLAVGMRSGA
jgi:5,10-methylenetetrahydromethanopterin reductase